MLTWDDIQQTLANITYVSLSGVFGALDHVPSPGRHSTLLHLLYMSVFVILKESAALIPFYLALCSARRTFVENIWEPWQQWRKQTSLQFCVSKVKNEPPCSNQNKLLSLCGVDMNQHQFPTSLVLWELKESSQVQNFWGNHRSFIRKSWPKDSNLLIIYSPLCWWEVRWSCIVHKTFLELQILLNNRRHRGENINYNNWRITNTKWLHISHPAKSKSLESPRPQTETT